MAVALWLVVSRGWCLLCGWCVGSLIVGFVGVAVQFVWLSGCAVGWAVCLCFGRSSFWLIPHWRVLGFSGLAGCLHLLWVGII